MGKTGLFSLELFRDFQDKERYFGKLTSDEDIGEADWWGSMFWRLVFSAGYGVVMGCYNGWEQAISSGVKVPTFPYFDAAGLLSCVLYHSICVRLEARAASYAECDTERFSYGFADYGCFCPYCDLFSYYR